MKGIKECVSAIVDGKILLCTKDNRANGSMLGDEIRLVEIGDGDVEIKSKSYTPEGGYSLSIFTDDTEWTEVITPVDFITAYNDCKENGNSYKGVNGQKTYGVDDQFMRRRTVSVEISDSSENACEIWLDCEWVKVVK